MPPHLKPLLAAVCLAMTGCEPSPGQDTGTLPASPPRASAAAETASDDTDAGSASRDVRSGDQLKGLAAMNLRGVRLERVLHGMQHPWAFEFLDERTVLVTQLRGKLFRYRLDTGEGTEIPGVPEVARGHAQTGLLDLALHPDFAGNGRIYFSYAVRAEAPESPGATGSDRPHFLTAVSTAVLAGDRLIDERRLLTAGPATWSPSNFGGALAFDDNGFLFVSVGDRSERHLAQAGHRLQGKILRLRDDGSVPADNPFVGDPAIDDRVYALGVRNPQGLHFDAPSGRLFETEHGPMGGDEVNLIEAGANYGWPDITYGKNYTDAVIGDGTHAEGLTQPLFYFTPSIAISPVTVYRGEQFPEWEGDLIVGALKAKQLARLDLDGGVVRSIAPFLRGLNARIRDVKVAGDGSIFVLIQFGALYRLSREPVAAVTGPEGAQIYAMACAGCHDSGDGGAPTLRDRERWDRIAAQPRAQIHRHTLEGIRAMPERGLCYLCSDSQLRAAADYMVETATTPATEAAR